MSRIHPELATLFERADAAIRDAQALREQALALRSGAEFRIANPWFVGCFAADVGPRKSEFDPALWGEVPWAKAEMGEKPEGSPYAKWLPSAPQTAKDDEPGDPGVDDEDVAYGLAHEEDQPRWPHGRRRSAWSY
jgi:hypothetical protein